MSRILLTAFEPYDVWSENSSWLSLIELTRWFDSGGKVVTRRYPVDLAEMTHRLSEDLMGGYAYAIHLGQSPGSTAIKLETTGLNTTTSGHPLIENGPASYRTDLPLDSWAEYLNAEGVPTVVSNHAGTYLCNAAMFLSQHFCRQRGLQTRSCFIHLPITPMQAARHGAGRDPLPSMSQPLMASALAMILTLLLSAEPSRVSELA